MLNKLWLNLKNQGVVEEGEKLENKIKDPWYILAMLGFAGLVASCILSVFIFILLGSRGVEGFAVIGVVCIISAYFLLKTKNVFLLSFGFSLSFLGQILIYINLFESIYNKSFVFFIITIFQLTLLLIIPTFLHKVISTINVAGAFGGLIFNLFENSNPIQSIQYIYIYMLFIMLLTAWFWVNEFRYSKKIELFQAIAYGLTIFLIGTEFFNVFAYSQYRYELGTGVDNIRNITDMASGIVLCYVVWQMFEKSKIPNLSFKIGALIIAILIGILSVKINGLAVAIMIVVLGFSASNLVLSGLGVISFLAFISHYYYYLEITLLEKSIYLLITGLGLLFARWLLLKKEKSFGVSNV